ncbi:MAG: EAL domain-containing protein, partial [Oscillospiraceae bacterium]
MTNKPNILIVDDNMVNRCLLEKILSGDYNILQAENGSEALELLKQEANSISAILLDLAMPVMDGFTFMELAKDLLLHYNIPVIVTTQNDCEDTELEALSLGATDFIAKPYRPRVILKRLENILHLKENSVLRNTVERDALTGIYNQETFFVKSHELMESNSTTQYAIICMDIEHFKLVNELWGTAEGDQLLKAIARELCTITTPDISICARISGDIFGLCMPYYPKIGTVLTDTVEKFIHRYSINLKLNFKFGIYVVDDITLPISGMCDRSKLAIQSIKGKFDATVALYDDSHRKRLIEEQEIISQMRSALTQGQFIPYYQPKYNLITGEIVGAEALIRWIHPTKGIIPPQRFIELFEKNGFISAVDFHIWECVCQHLRKVLDQGKVPLPISVNVSRVDVYNPQLCSFLQELINKYRIEPRFLELEITENSYIDNAEELIKTINDLKKMGFTIEMDDFGSGYSSLNMLSDVPVDVIKLDMRFLQSKNAFSGQRNILNFIVSLAKWLDIQTVAEGVETLEQVSFLRSIGYSVGQGYYFARPMPQEDYEKLAMENQGVSVGATTHAVLSELLDYSEIWNPTSQFNIVFKMFAAPLALWEFADGKLSFLRGNDSLG